MLLKACPRCRKLIPYASAYCAGCKSIVEEEKCATLEERKKKWNARYNQKRDRKYLRFYASTDWKRTSKAKLQEVGYRCEECGGLAVEVHHINPIQTDSGWERRLDWSNLKALCLGCHNKAHGRFVPRKKTHRNQSQKPINR